MIYIQLQKTYIIKSGAEMSVVKKKTNNYLTVIKNWIWNYYPTALYLRT